MAAEAGFRSARRLESLPNRFLGSASIDSALSLR